MFGRPASLAPPGHGITRSQGVTEWTSGMGSQEPDPLVAAQCHRICSVGRAGFKDDLLDGQCPTAVARAAGCKRLVRVRRASIRCAIVNLCA